MKLPKGCEIEVLIYADVPSKYFPNKLCKNYLLVIDHKIQGDIRRLSERNISSSRDNLIILTIRSENTNMVFELTLPAGERDKVVQYRKLVKEEADWLRKEIAFLTNRMRGFNHLTPKPLREEVQNKLNKYQEDLKCYEINYGV